MGRLQAWLEDFAWTEEEKASKLAQRNANAPPGRGRDLAGQPMFCLETAMHCLYWSHLVYDYGEVRGVSLPRVTGTLSTGSITGVHYCHHNSLRLHVCLGGRMANRPRREETLPASG